MEKRVKELEVSFKEYLYMEELKIFVQACIEDGVEQPKIFLVLKSLQMEKIEIFPCPPALTHSITLG